MPEEPYKPHKAADGTWQFTTATQPQTGFPDRFSALKAAATTEMQDRRDAKNGTGAVANALRKFFGITKAGAGRRPLDLHPCKD